MRSSVWSLTDAPARILASSARAKQAAASAASPLSRARFPAVIQSACWATKLAKISNVTAEIMSDQTMPVHRRVGVIERLQSFARDDAIWRAVTSQQ